MNGSFSPYAATPMHSRVVVQLPLLTIGDVSCLESWERAEILAGMKMMPSEKVLEWKYVTSILSPNLIADANAQV